MRTALVLSMLGALLGGCGGGPAARTPVEGAASTDDCRGSADLNLDGMERAVLMAAVGEMYLKDKGGGKPGLLIIWDKTDAWLERFREKRGGFLLVPRALLNDFEVRNGSAHPLPPDLKLGVPHKTIAEDELRDLVKVKGGQRDWDAYHDRYPLSEVTGIISLSRVAFNADYTEALVYVGNGCGSGCGKGAYLYLGREGCAWQVREYYGGWMS